MKADSTMHIGMGEGMSECVFRVRYLYFHLMRLLTSAALLQPKCVRSNEFETSAFCVIQEQIKLEWRHVVYAYMCFVGNGIVRTQ